MEPLVLIDSNVYIDFLNSGVDPVREICRQLSLDDIASCGVVKAEVLRGVKGQKQRDRLDEFFSVTQMLTTPASLWDEVWQLAWKLDRQGKVLPLQDIVIGCCALRASASVMTRDKHFREIDGLRVLPPP
jgi:predicted nucleic acid-binding protein